MITKIAKKIVISYLQTKNIFLNKIVEFSKKFSKSLDKYFVNDLLKDNIIQFKNRFNLSDISEQFENKIINIHVIMCYVDKISEKDYISGVMKTNFQAGMAEALKHKNEMYIVIYGSTEKQLECFNKKYFRQSFIHELMHIIDRQVDENFNNEFYYGHPVENIKENNGVPFPGMYGDDDDIFEEQFAEYYTCQAEQKEYIFDLINSIEDYAQTVKQPAINIVNLIIKALDNKKNFMTIVNNFQDKNVNYSPLAFIYHLSFSKQQNGNKQDAIKILKELN